MSSPKVSVCIPAYKRPNLMRECLESINKQTFTDYEVIITDDSPDNKVEEVVDEFRNKIVNLIYRKNISPKGSPENWNECMKMATGEYIKMIHCDDFLSNELSLHKYVKMLDENPHADFAFSSSGMCDKNRNVTKTHQPDQKNIDDLSEYIGLLFSGNLIGAPSATIHRRNNIFYDKKLQWLVDIVFYTMQLKSNPHFTFTREPLVVVSYEGDDKITNECANNKCVLFREYLYAYKKMTTSGIKIKMLDYLKVFWGIIRGHNIQRETDLSPCGLLNKIPLQIKALIVTQRIIRLFSFKK